MIIGAMNNPKKDIVSEIYAIGEMGFDFLELTVEPPAAEAEQLKKRKKEILDALSSYNFGVLSHYAWYLSVAHPYHSIQKAIISEFKKSFEAASLFGAKKATIHTEFMPPSVQEKTLQVARTIETIKELSKEAENLGMELLVENYGPSSFSIEDFEKLFSQLDVGMTLDIGHATAYDSGPEVYIAKFKRKIKHIHMHDNDKRADLHLPLFAGKIDFKKLVSKLKEFYNDTITLEVHSPDTDYLKLSREKLEILWFGKKKFKENQEYICPK